MNAKTVAFVSRHRDRSEPSCRMMRGLNSGFVRRSSWLIVRWISARERSASASVRTA